MYIDRSASRGVLDPFDPSVIAVREKMGSKILDQRRTNSPVYKFVKEWGVPTLTCGIPYHAMMYYIPALAGDQPYWEDLYKWILSR